MSGIGICSCATVSFGNTGRPPCVIEMGKLEFPLLVPRFGTDGTRNVIDTGIDPASLTNAAGTAGTFASVGAWIKDKTENSAWLPQDRFYALPKVETATFERTETAYETAASGKKFKLNSGGVRTVAFELWGKSAVGAINRELNKFGCSDLDYYHVANGAMWGIKDDLSTSILRGFEMAEDTMDVFKVYATDTTVPKLNVSFDLDNDECEQNAFAITNEELGYKSTSLSGLIAGTQVVSNPTTTTLSVDTQTSFGSASVAGSVVGLVDTDFVVTSDVSGVLAHTGTVEADGTYVITLSVAVIVGHVLTVKTNATGYDLADGTITIV